MQESNESEEAYLRALYVPASDCEFGALKTERIREWNYRRTVGSKIGTSVPNEVGRFYLSFCD